MCQNNTNHRSTQFSRTSSFHSDKNVYKLTILWGYSGWTTSKMTKVIKNVGWRWFCEHVCSRLVCGHISSLLVCVFVCVHVVVFGWDLRVLIEILWSVDRCGKRFLIPSLLRVGMLLGPTEGGPLSGYRSAQQHAVVLVHSKITHTHRYTAIIGWELKVGLCETGAIINQSAFSFE